MPDINDNLPKDASRKVLQTAGSVVFQDDTSTPQESPLTTAIHSTSVTAIAIPANAVEIEVSASGALRVGADDDLSDGYYVVPANTPKRFMVAKMSTIYIAGDSAEVTTQFHFNVV